MPGPFCRDTAMTSAAPGLYCSLHCCLPQHPWVLPTEQDSSAPALAKCTVETLLRIGTVGWGQKAIGHYEVRMGKKKKITIITTSSTFCREPGKGTFWGEIWRSSFAETPEVFQRKHKGAALKTRAEEEVNTGWRKEKWAAEKRKGSVTWEKWSVNNMDKNNNKKEETKKITFLTSLLELGKVIFGFPGTSYNWRCEKANSPRSTWRKG